MSKDHGEEKPVYEGNDVESGNFQVNVFEEGVYNVEVTKGHVKCSIDVRIGES